MEKLWNFVKIFEEKPPVARKQAVRHTNLRV